jgi:hypothetical protein
MINKPKFLAILAVSSLLGVILGSYLWPQSSLQTNLSADQLPRTTLLQNFEPSEFIPQQIRHLLILRVKQLTIAKSPYEKFCTSASNAYLKLPLKTVDPIFRACADDLLKRTQVPLMLPPVAPPFKDGDESQKLYAFLSIRSTTVDSYNIGLTWLPGDYPQYQGQQAVFVGAKLTPQSPTLKEIFKEKSAFAEQSPFFRGVSGSVILSNGIQGYFIPAVCGASCHAAYGRVIWDQDGYRYRIGIKMAQKEEVLRVVNGAIANQRF